jgi:N-sulfoglucosamine sulfohydrolase
MRAVNIRFLVSFCLVSAVAVNAAHAQTRPNILLIIADDLGLQLGSYGDQNITTPNIDSIGEQGIRFTRAFSVQASCSSSRSGIYTGMFPHQNGQVGLYPSFSMSEPFPVLPTLLKQAGYRTGLIGKQHVAPDAAFDWDFVAADRDWVNWPYNTSDVSRVDQEVQQFIGEAQSASVPFFLQLSLYDPHHWIDGACLDQVDGIPSAEELIDPDTILWNYYRDVPFPVDQREEAAHYYNGVKRLDIGVGMILESLDNAGVFENTLVIFTSDHSGTPPSIQGGKADIRDASNHVPLLIRFPAVRTQPSAYGGLVSLIDLFPTILEAAGDLPIPEQTASLMTDARSLMPLISGNPENYRLRPTIFTEMTYHDEGLYRPARSIRTYRWHLIKYYLPFERGTDSVQLFDLQADPLEYNDLSGDPAYNATKEFFLRRLADWQLETGDPLLGCDTDNASNCIVGTAGDDDLLGTQEMDTIFGFGGNDTLNGRFGNDRLYGGDGDDTLLGGPDDDILSGGEGTDYFNGWTGSDTVDFSYTDAPLFIDLGPGYIGFATSLSTGESEEMRFIENAIGSGGDSFLIGGEGDNVLNGGPGGNDTLNGGPGGVDTLIGGPGDDVFEYQADGTNSVLISDASGMDKLRFVDFDPFAGVSRVANIGDIDLVFEFAGGGSLTIELFFAGQPVELLNYRGIDYPMDTGFTGSRSLVGFLGGH